MQVSSPLKKAAALRDGAPRLLSANGKGLRRNEKPLVLRSSVRSLSKHERFFNGLLGPAPARMFGNSPTTTRLPIRSGAKADLAARLEMLRGDVYLEVEWLGTSIVEPGHRFLDHRQTQDEHSRLLRGLDRSLQRDFLARSQIAW